MVIVAQGNDSSGKIFKSAECFLDGDSLVGDSLDIYCCSHCVWGLVVWSLFIDAVCTIRAELANIVESDLGRTASIYFDNVTLTSQKLCQQNNKCDCSEMTGYNIPR